MAAHKNRRLRFRYSLRLLLVAMAAVSFVFGWQVYQTRKQRMITAACIKGLKKHRESLRSGYFLAHRVMRSRHRLSRAVTGEEVFEVSYTFDGSKRRISTWNDDDQKVTIELPDRFVFYRSSDHTAEIFPPEFAKSRHVQYFDICFDIRDMGLLNYQEMMGDRYGAERLFDDCFSQAQVVEAVKERGVYRVSWERNDGNDVHRRTYWFDPKVGYAPIRFEIRAVPSTQNDLAKVPVVAGGDVTWEKHNDIYVPISCKLFNAYGTHEVTVTFDWQEINGELDPFAFSVESVGNPETLTVWDCRRVPRKLVPVKYWRSTAETAGSSK